MCLSLDGEKRYTKSKHIEQVYKQPHTSYLAFKTVIGFKTNPTDVLAIAPATRFPGTLNLTMVVLLDLTSDDAEFGGRGIAP